MPHQNSDQTQGDGSPYEDPLKVILSPQFDPDMSWGGRTYCNFLLNYGQQETATFIDFLFQRTSRLSGASSPGEDGRMEESGKQSRQGA